MKNLNTLLKDESGQMAILAMLVLVIALTIGLSIIARTTQNIKFSNNTELSTRAYNAAEAGVEEALRTGSSSLSGSFSGSNANFTVSTVTQGGNTQVYSFPNPITKDDANQVWLFNYDYYKNNNGSFPSTGGGNYFNDCGTSACQNITVYWGSGSQLSNPPVSNDSQTPALEASLIYKSSGGFGVEKYAVDPSSTRGNGFENQNTSGTIYARGPWTPANTAALATTTQGAKSFYYKYTIPLAASSSKQYLLMRVKLLYSDQHELAIDPRGATLPSQGELINAQGTANDLVRKIKVYRSYPTLPNIFDFVLFNGSSSPLQK